MSATSGVLGRGVAAGLAGAAGMTAFQLLEMRVIGREESDQPARLVARLLPVRPRSARGWRALNYAAHTGVGVSWGVARALAARHGLRGQRGTLALFALLWNLDWVAVAALGLDPPPWRWTPTELAVDLVDKLVMLECASVVLERLE